MVNLSVAYQRPDKSTARLFVEVRLAFGDPRAENKGFVAGSGPTTWNESSHNADAYGVAHAVDIGVDIEGDGTGIPVSAAEPLANFLRGFIGSRVAYVIYNHRIDTGNGWQPYYGISPHEDHIHVSTTWDYYWGDYAPAMAWNPDDSAVWGVAGSITPGGSEVRPIEEKDWFDTVDENTLSNLFRKLLREESPKAVWGMSGKRPGEKGDQTMWNRVVVANEQAIRAAANSGAALELAKQTAAKQGLDISKIDAAVQAAVKKALEDGTVNVDINVGGPNG